MAPSHKKKKKILVNSRPIATISVPSKRVDISKSDVSTASSPAELEELKPTSKSISSPPSQSVETRELHELSPDELERHLQDAEVASFAERFSSKVQREASRHSARLQSECRVLRAQSETLLASRTFPQQLQAKIIELALSEIRASSSSSDQRVLKNELSREDLLSNLWILEKILFELGFLRNQITDALKWVLIDTTPSANSYQIWGLERSVDWLSLKFDEHELPRLDSVSGKPITEMISTGRLETDDSEAEPPSNTNGTDQHEKMETIKNSLASTSEEEDFDVSDIGSDLEPDELISTYLKTKTRLYEERPDLADFAWKTSGKSRKDDASHSSVSTVSIGVSKLQNKLRKLEADILFDKIEANEKWFLKKNELAQEFGQKRKLQLIRVKRDKPSELSSNLIVNDHSEQVADTMSEDDDQIDLGDLFGALPVTDSNSEQLSGTKSNETNTIRDFGQWKGMNPRRVLEEACRARDSQSQISYKLESTTAFSNRHSLHIVWSKPQSRPMPLTLTSTICSFGPQFSTFVMSTIATPDWKQSEAYISTIALFQIFATSRKEDKVYLRLPPTWRNVWSELAHQWQEEIGTTNRQEIRTLMNLVHEQLSQSEDEDEVLTKNFRTRHSKPNTRNNSQQPTADRCTSVDGDGPVQHLMDLWTAKTATHEYLRMLPSRQMLPIFQFKEEAMKTIEENQITIISGETGCGKSTQMPAYILEREMSRGQPCKIYCTEPRRISAITLAQRVSQELGERRNYLGTSRSLIGYSIRLESMVSDETRLVYATTGIVLRMLEAPEGFQDITHIIIDEVHERSIETDFLLIILKSLVSKKPNLKVILMSATLDTQRFSKYFDGAPIISVPGRTFPVETKYLEDAIELTGYRIGDEGYTQHKDIDDDNDPVIEHEEAYHGYSSNTRSVLSTIDEYRIDYSLILMLIERIAFDPNYVAYAQAILIFLPGIAEIKKLNDLLLGTSIMQQFVVHSLHSSIASEDQQAAFTPPPSGYRKIVIATNIAETGVTIPDVTCVIDTVKHKEMRFDEKRQISRLIESFISKANAKQRRGRAGRVQNGICFHLFTRARHENALAEQQTPEMLRLSLQDLVMRVKICKLGDIETTLAEALDPPSTKNVRRAIDTLIEVSALTATEELTALGLLLAKLPLDPYLGKLVLLGAVFGCLDFTLTTASIITSKSPFNVPLGSRQQADSARLSFKKDDSDLVTDYNAYSAWRRVCISGNNEIQFCRRNFLSQQNLSNIEDLKIQLMSSLVDLGFVSSQIRSTTKPYHNRFVEVPAANNMHHTNTDLIRAVTAGAFYPKILVRDGNGWRNIATNQAVQLHPASVPRQTHAAGYKYLSFYSILQSGGGRAYNASSLTPVGPLALLLLTGDVSFHSMAQVISLDGSRLRYRMEGWKAFVALKLLRKRLDEVLEWKWKKPAVELPTRLKSWMDIWNELVEEWNTNGA